MNYTFIQKTKLLVGAGESHKLGALILDAGYKKPFIVFDPGVMKIGAITTESLGIEEYNLEYVIYDEVIPNPPSDAIDRGGQLARQYGCDCVVAIGGGSALDTAKGINILRFNEGSILDYAREPDKMKFSPGLICIPTTSGTGSELSDGVIVTDSQTGSKLPVLALMGMSEYAIIDPELTLGVPRRLTISTGLDVFSHAFEGYTSNKANDICDLVVEKIMETVIEYLPKAVNNPGDLEARTKMAVAATMAGWMLGNVSTYVGHSVAHVIGAKMHIVHGEACAYDLPGVMEYISSVFPQKVRNVGEMLGETFSEDMTAEEIGKATAKAYIKFRDEVLDMHPVSDYNIDESIISECVDEVLQEPFFENTAGTINRNDVETIIRKALNLV